ncbi:TetR/AcrR family transcriptional regulator [Cnuibacter physcomitrellae]|uniref:TetR/AcrR family transcriptional regulator n=1 Tax=Cnuibacter physcomitrellae TaxID=1619308 RepID=UPI002175CF0F|nr:TetR/AcrR family transcriptional regulator [Cnuibacter physcomitrellae]MCS5495921.1 TetR/AcrR family transcriptional regulator [Cnuibacter physcomitrellae]
MSPTPAARPGPSTRPAATARPAASTRPDAADDLRAIALRMFAQTGYAGTSLQQIADAAGYSKSSVLYHFSSKEALFESAIEPAVKTLGAFLDNSVRRVRSAEELEAFVEEFIDVMLAHRSEVHIIINQGRTLTDIGLIDEALGYIERIGESVMAELPSATERMRLSIALAGAAYILAVSPVDPDDDEMPVDEVREALVEVLTDLLRPLSA